MFKELKKIIKGIFLSGEAVVLWSSAFIILFLMYRSSPYWSSLILNYTFSTFLFLLLPISISIFPSKKTKSNYLLWSLIFTLSVAPLLAGEVFPLFRNRIFPQYSTLTGPLYRWEIFLLLVLPVFILIFFSQKKLNFSLKKIGLGFGKWKLWIPITIAFLLIITPILWFLSRNPEFRSTYPLFKGMIRSDTDFWLIDLSWFYYLLIWEFFFRGFILFKLAEKMGVYRAIFFQAVIFSFAHLGKPEIETYSSLVGGVLVGLLAYYSRSILPCAIIHWAIAIIMDIFVYFF